jgi:hypothetical protein
MDAEITVLEGKLVKVGMMSVLLGVKYVYVLKE